MFRLYAKVAPEGLLVRTGRPHKTALDAMIRAATMVHAIVVELRRVDEFGAEHLVDWWEMQS